MGRNVNLNVEYLTRVEGHGNIVVNVKEGKLGVDHNQTLSGSITLYSYFSFHAISMFQICMVYVHMQKTMVAIEMAMNTLYPQPCLHV